MSPKAFLALLVVTVGSVAWATQVVRSQHAAASSTSLDMPLAPGLGDKLDAVARIAVDGKDLALTAERDGDGWKIVEKDGYAADPAKLRDLVLAAANTRRIEAKTADPARLARLELGDPTAADAKSKRLTLLDASGAKLAAIVIGKKKYGLFGATGSGSYVRLDGEDQSWLADRALDLPTKAADWMTTEIVDIPAADIKAVTLGLDGAEPLTLEKADKDAPSLTLPALAEGEQADTAKIDRLAGMLAKLSLRDVRKAPGDAGQPQGRATFSTFDGLTVEVRLSQTGEGDAKKSWLTLSASGSGDAEARAEALNARWSPWAFEVSPASAERAGWQRADLLKKADRVG